MDKKIPAILYLDRNGFYFYTLGMENVATCVFPETMVRDLEVVDPFGVENQIKTFVNQLNLPPFDISIVLSSNIVFEKIVQSGSGELEEINKFLEEVPFERYEKIITIEEGNKRVFAANKNLTYCLEMSFTKVGSSVSIVVPYYPLSNLLQTLPLDVSSAQAILKKVGDLKSYNMKRIEEKQEIRTSVDTSSGQQKTPVNKNRIYILAAVFVVLIGVMLFMIFKH
ncbi:MAG: hypothetical protein ACM3IJ_03570 [Candidatus Levyibacteriota bacterium]